MTKKYRIVRNKLGKFIPQVLSQFSVTDEWHPLLLSDKGVVEFDKFEDAEAEIYRRQYEVVATYD